MHHYGNTNELRNWHVQAPPQVSFQIVCPIHIDEAGLTVSVSVNAVLVETF